MCALAVTAREEYDILGQTVSCVRFCANTGDFATVRSVAADPGRKTPARKMTFSLRLLIRALQCLMANR